MALGIPDIVDSKVVDKRVAPAQPKRAFEHAQQATFTAPSGSPQDIAKSIVPSGQLDCFDHIITRESGWDLHATNPTTGAYGLAQALPGNKMASAGAD
jgi:hypothetical protein